MVFTALNVVLAGVAASVFAWIMGQAVLSNTGSANKSDIPRMWRLVWPLITLLSPCCGPFITWPQRDLIARWGRLAGFPAAVTPSHLVAGWVSVVILGAGCGAVLMVVAGLHDSIVFGAVFSAIFVGSWAISALLGRVRKRRRLIERDLPFVLDLMTLSVESGLSLHASLQQAELHGPSGPLRDELMRTLSNLRSGMPRLLALHTLAERSDCPAVRAWVAALVQGDRLGMNVGVLMREHAAQCRAERLQRAEKLAMQAPVKMLFPLIGCIFPCTFIVLAFPIAVQIWHAFP